MTRNPRSRALACGLATTGVLGAAGVALAAPDREAGTLTGASPTYAWDGGPVTGTPVAAVDDDTTLITLAEAGTLRVAIGEASSGGIDLDLLLFNADAAGDPTGTELAKSETETSDEAITYRARAGRYVVVATGWLAVQGTYKGKATLTPAAGPSGPTGPVLSPSPVPSPSPAPTPAPDARPGASVKAIKAFRAGTRPVVRGTASDDKGVAKVGVAVVRKGGKPKAYRRARGKARWSYRLPALRRGVYELYVQVTDTNGQTARARRAFRVRAR